MLHPARLASILAAIAAPALVACGGPGSFSGTVNGMSLNVKESFFILETDTPGVVQDLTLVLTDVTGLCEALEAGADIGSDTSLILAVHQTDNNGNALTPTPGDYHPPVPGAPMPPPKFVDGALMARDASCQVTQWAGTTSGRMTLDVLQAQPGGSMIGSFDFTFQGGNQGLGNFHAAFCNAHAETVTCR